MDERTHKPAGWQNRDQGTLTGGSLARAVQKKSREVAIAEPCVYGCGQMIYQSLMVEHNCANKQKNLKKLNTALKPK